MSAANRTKAVPYLLVIPSRRHISRALSSPPRISPALSFPPSLSPSPSALSNVDSESDSNHQ